MFLKLLLISVILVAIMMLGLGIKLILSPKAEFKGGTCGMKNEDGSVSGCSMCSADPSKNCSTER